MAVPQMAVAGQNCSEQRLMKVAAVEECHVLQDTSACEGERQWAAQEWWMEGGETVERSSMVAYWEY